MKQALTSIIITKLHLFQVEREFSLGDAVEFYKTFFGIAPKTLNSVYVNFAVSKELFMVNINMSITAKHQRVIASKFIGVDDAAASHCLNRKVKKRICSYIFDGLDLDYAITLQNAENRHFPYCPSAAFAFASASEIAFVHLDYPAEEIGGIRGTGNDGSAYQIDRLQDRRVAKTGLLSYLSGREFKFKELYNPEPVLVRDTQLINPPSGKCMEGITTPFAAEPSTDYPVDFTASASCAKITAIFST